MIGPVERIEYAPGRFAELFLLRFDKDGRLLSPQTAAQFRGAAELSSDVFCFAHGWNNVYGQALDRYKNFIAGYIALRAEQQIPLPDGYRPVLLGIIWPSTSFVFPGEAGPDIAGGDRSAAARETEELLEFVTESLDDTARITFTELIDGTRSVTEQDARKLAEIVLAALATQNDPDTGQAPPDVDEILTAWQALGELTAPPVDLGDADEVGAVDDGPADAGAPRPAGGLSFDPRDLLRTATVWKMKGRAGVVGAHGVGPLIREILAGPGTARVHLVGHSFGARVQLSALAADLPARKVHSVLLLQPAINRWCFAPDVAETGRAGGYHVVLDRVERPIYSTFSRFDQPLHEFFHLAVRGSSLGEPNIAAVGDTYLYGALGGYGPEGLGALANTHPAVAPGTPYPVDGGYRVLAIDGGVRIGGEPAIAGHSEISNRVT